MEVNRWGISHVHQVEHRGKEEEAQVKGHQSATQISRPTFFFQPNQINNQKRRRGRGTDGMLRLEWHQKDTRWHWFTHFAFVMIDGTDVTNLAASFSPVSTKIEPFGTCLPFRDRNSTYLTGIRPDVDRKSPAGMDFLRSTDIDKSPAPLKLPPPP